MLLLTLAGLGFYYYRATVGFIDAAERDRTAWMRFLSLFFWAVPSLLIAAASLFFGLMPVLKFVFGPLIELRNLAKGQPILGMSIFAAFVVAVILLEYRFQKFLISRWLSQHSIKLISVRLCWPWQNPFGMSNGHACAYRLVVQPEGEEPEEAFIQFGSYYGFNPCKVQFVSTKSQHQGLLDFIARNGPQR